MTKKINKTPNYEAKLRNLMGRAIADFQMISADERIVVGISGGVDSLILMHTLNELQKRAPISFELFGVTIDEGFSKIDHFALQKYAQEMDWNLKIISAPIAQLVKEKGVEKNPCGLCSRLRRGYIHGYADEVGAKVLALGHHRDDLCVSFLMGLFRGTGLKTMGPNVAADEGSKRLIRPLCYVPKSLIEQYAQTYDFPKVGNCNYADHLKKSGDRARLERLLLELENDFPHLTSNMLKSLSDVRPKHLLDARFLDNFHRNLE